MFQKLRALLLLSLLAISTWSQATFHIVQINEVYSNASGTVQFIEITMLANGQNLFSGQTLTSTQGGNVNSFTFQKNLANATAGDSVLIGTTGYAALPGVPAPDFIVPNGFVFTSNVTISFAGVDSVTLATVPTDGTRSVNRSGVTATNSPRNNARTSGTVVLAASASIALTSNANPAGYGAAVILTSSVAGNTPTGTVSFEVSGSIGFVPLPGCSPVPLINGAATCTAPGSFQTVGSRQYRARYSGDTNNQANSVVFSQPIAINNAVLSLSATPLPPIVGGRTAVLSALVKMASPSGTVSFADNGAVIAGCSQLAVSILPDATDAAVATCSFAVPTGVTGIRQYGATYSYPAGHISGRISEQTSFDLRLVAQGPADYTDMWWTGGTENGWGMSVSQHGPIQFNVIFAYDNAGKALWYVMPGGSFNAAGTVFTGALFLPSSAPFSAYDKSLFAVGPSVGSASITYTSNSTATLTFTINGISATKSIQRQIFAAETTGPNLRTNDLWWATFTEDGWGMNITQQGRVLFPVWYTYDATGKATFFTAQGGTWNGTVWTGTVYAHTSAAWLGVPYNGSQFTATIVGSIALDFTDASTAVMTYTVNGFTQVKRIERQPY